MAIIKGKKITKFEDFLNCRYDNLIFKQYLKDPLSTIAVNSTFIFIAGCLFFGSLAVFGIVSEFIRDYNDPLVQNINIF